MQAGADSVHTRKIAQFVSAPGSAWQQAPPNS
jgi:hypothetical protein